MKKKYFALLGALIAVMMMASAVSAAPPRDIIGYWTDDDTYSQPQYVEGCSGTRSFAFDWQNESATDTSTAIKIMPWSTGVKNVQMGNIENTTHQTCQSGGICTDMPIGKVEGTLEIDAEGSRWPNFSFLSVRAGKMVDGEFTDSSYSAHIRCKHAE